MRLEEEFSVAQIAIWRTDESRITAHSKNLSRIAKEIRKLASINFISTEKLSNAPIDTPYDDEAEMIEAINDVLKVTVLVLALLFGGLSVSHAFRKPSSMGLSFGVKSKNVSVEGGNSRIRGYVFGESE
ncbi:hypothetical protein PHJA_001776100 [Phtheirospermum japonicum]|uniref:Uncharacterized protein n=1 Tax=Phtheirospermum japonicum TaxID=374723 RepID=A0A830C9R7_9LAMI|nr:hypothetical protein PHJA_001776100 [Phtheirospermum japonicum]